MLKRMDANGNGNLDPEEMSDRMMQFMGPQLRAAGLDPTKPISLEKLGETIQNARGQQQGDDEAADPADLLVPTFGEPVSLVYPPDFNLPADSPLLDPRPISERYDESIVRRVDDVFRQYDLNRDDLIDRDEIRRIRFSTPWQEFDLDSDGQLKRVELAERYAAREQGERDSRQQREDDWRRRREESNERRGRDDDDDDDNRGGRDWRQRRSDGDSEDSGRDSNSSRERNRERSPEEDAERYANYANSLIQRYDKNEDGELQKEEWSEMRGNWDDADKDGDGTIGSEELVGKLQSFQAERENRNSGGDDDNSSRNNRSSRNSEAYRFQTLDEKLDEIGVGDDFTRDDRNLDGQLQMVEFVSEWTSDNIEEFRRRDVNQDGVITPQEWIETGRGRRGG